MWPMPNVMVALPNIGGTLCSTLQSLADAQYQNALHNAAKTRDPLKLSGMPQTTGPSLNSFYNCISFLNRGDKLHWHIPNEVEQVP